MRHIYFHERDPQTGVLLPRTDGRESLTDEERLRRRWKLRYPFLTGGQIDLLWREFLQREAYRAHLLAQGGRTEEEIERELAEYRRRQLRRR